jgi:hypothetical protein
MTYNHAQWLTDQVASEGKNIANEKTGDENLVGNGASVIFLDGADIDLIPPEDLEQFSRGRIVGVLSDALGGHTIVGHIDAFYKEDPRVIAARSLEVVHNIVLEPMALMSKACVRLPDIPRQTRAEWRKSVKGKR